MSQTRGAENHFAPSPLSQFPLSGTPVQPDYTIRNLTVFASCSPEQRNTTESQEVSRRRLPICTCLVAEPEQRSAGVHAEDLPLAGWAHGAALGCGGVPDDRETLSQDPGLSGSVDAEGRLGGEFQLAGRDDQAGGVKCFRPPLTSNGIQDTLLPRPISDNAQGRSAPHPARTPPKPWRRHLNGSSLRLAVGPPSLLLSPELCVLLGGSGIINTE